MSEDDVWVPARVCSEGRLPDRCSRHGRGQVRRKYLALQSRVQHTDVPRRGSNPLTAFARVGERARKARITWVRGWPLCATCVRTRVFWFGLVQVLFWGGVLLLVGAVVARVRIGQEEVLAAPAVAGLAMMLCSVLPFVRGSYGRILGARTSQDGEHVILDRPAPEFVRRLPAAERRE